MSLFERKHLGKQEEDISESGVQLRDDEPSAPKDDQIWINLSQNRLKVRKNGETYILVEGEIGAALEIPPDGILDAVNARSFYKNVTSDLAINGITNYPDGGVVYALVSNTNPNVKEVTKVTVGSPTLINGGSYFHLNSASNIHKYFVWVDYDGLNTEPFVEDRTGIRVLTSAGLKERTQLIMPPSGIASGNHILLSDANNANNFYLWFNDGGGLDPMLEGKTGIQVVVDPLDTGPIYAEKVSDALNSLPNFTSTWSDSTVIFENTSVGPSTPTSNVSVTGIDIQRLQAGKVADTPLEFATKMAAAINSIPHFNVPVPTTNEIIITNEDFGFTEDAENVNMGSNVTITTIEQGSGKVKVTFPPNFILSENELDADVLGMSSRLFKFFKVTGNVLVLDCGTFNL